ncbi:MAG TPA: hypothetical protein VE093_09960 [Polyangiaceae bacterium]|nr:hypothetical protein [Polyangiaceae bacterium]
MMNPSKLDELARTPSPASWEDVTAAADALAPAKAQAGIAALEGAVQGWAPDPVRRWWSSMTAWRVKGAGSWVSGELRRAPLSWVKEILDGEHHPKHSLARALSLEGTKATATNAARVFESPHLSNLRALDTGRDVKLARAFYKKLAKATNLGAVDTLTYYPLQLGGGEELAAATNLGALRHLHLRAIVYSVDNSACAADVDALFRAPWLKAIETLESSMGRSTGWYRMASIYKPLREHSARLTSLRRLVLHDTTWLEELVAAPVLDQIEEIVLQVETAQALKAVLEQLDARGLPRLRRLDVSQHRSTSAQKKDSFTPLPDRQLRSIVEATKLSKQVRELLFAQP